MHRLSSVFELWQRGATASGREVHQPELSFELCQVMQPPSSDFELCQAMQPLSSVFELWQRGAIA